MFIALYRWKLKPGHEAQFQTGWHRGTQEIYCRWGSLGSRLHRAEDGTWVAYAQWPDRLTWEGMGDILDPEIRALMHESIDHSYPTLCLEVVDDLLALTPNPRS
jgi:hypothetical protein